MKKCLVRISCASPQMPAKIFFFKHIPTLLTSRDMLLPKKGPQVTCDMIRCLRVCLQPIKEVPEEHVSKEVVGEERGGGYLGTNPIYEQLKEEWGRGWDSHLCPHTTSHQETLFPTDSSTTEQLSKANLRPWNNFLLNLVLIKWALDEISVLEITADFFCLDSVHISLFPHPHFAISNRLWSTSFI